MRTNGFALFKGDGAPSRALEAERRVRRYSKEVLLGAEGEFLGTGEARLAGKKEVTLAYSLEGSGFPVVHGYADGPSALPEGEFSLMGEGAPGLYAARDPLGTRGLWVEKAGPGRGSLSSDYRLLSSTAALVPRGAVYSRGRARKVARAKKKGLGKLTFEEAAEELASLVEASVERRVRGLTRVAVSFSGGLDSSLLAMVASKRCEVVLCSAFAPGSRDETQSERAAALLGLRLETAVLDEETLEKCSKEAELPPGEATLMDTALWCIYSTTSRLAAANKARTIILGQLADELFGGYMKYALKAKEEGAKAAERMMDGDVKACADRGFLRDEAACAASCEARFPYADERVAAFAAGLPFSHKIRDGERKAVLRAAALKLGLPEELATAPKKAAQFSSGAARLLKGK